MTDAGSAATLFPTHTMANGLRVVAQPMGGVESCALGFCVATGSRDETPSQAGISHFIDSLAYQGTARRDVRALTESFEDLGARHDAGAGTELFWYTAQALGRELEGLVPLLAEVVRMPRFDPDEAEKVRDRLLQELAQLEDEPMQKIFEVLQTTFFAGHPYGNSSLGNEETIRALGPEDLRAHWGRTQRPNNTIVAAAGKFQFDALVRAVESACGEWEPADVPPLPAAPAIPSGARALSLTRESNQQHIAVGLNGVAVGDPDYYAVALLGTILGGSMNSRLFTEVREKRGLAYGVGAYPGSLRDSGIIRIYAGTTPPKAHETVEVIFAELRKLEDAGVAEDELARAKTLLKSRVIMGGERTGGRRSVIGSSLWYEGKVRTLDESRALIESVNTAQILAMVRRLEFSTSHTLVTIGPRTAEELLA